MDMNEFHQHFAVTFQFCITGKPIAEDADYNGWAEPARRALLGNPTVLTRYLSQRMLGELDQIGEGGSIDQGLGPFVLEADDLDGADLLRQTGTTDPQVLALIETLEDPSYGDSFLELEPLHDSFSIRITDAAVQELMFVPPPTPASKSQRAPRGKR
jgi:hypothetical protein